MKCENLAREFHRNLKLDEFYTENFEWWYKDCFDSCMNEAVDEILNGNGSYEEGTMVEISKVVSKSGNPELIYVTQKDLIEYFGEEACENMFFMSIDDFVEGDIEEMVENLSNFFIETVGSWTKEASKKAYEYKSLYLNDMSYNVIEQKLNKEARNIIVTKAENEVGDYEE